MEIHLPHMAVGWVWVLEEAVVEEGRLLLLGETVVMAVLLVEAVVVVAEV